MEVIEKKCVRNRRAGNFPIRISLTYRKLEILKGQSKTRRRTIILTILWFNFAFNTTKFGRKSPAHVYLLRVRACHNNIKF